MLERLVHRVAIVRRLAIGAGLGLNRTRAAEPLTAVHGLIVDERVVAAVHRHEQLPLFLRAPLAQDARHGVARGARIGGDFVGGIRILNRPPFRVELNRMDFFR